MDYRSESPEILLGKMGKNRFTRIRDAKKYIYIIMWGMERKL